ncbi:MAG TPA: hypothetical protein VLJ16_06845 [Acidobacteriota bacterium]|nr:hypothetical protein [Acidobacteriota bacterium]
MRVAAVVILAAALAAASACGTAGPVEVRVSMPGITALPAGSFGEVIVTDFREISPPADLPVGRGLRDVLAEAIDRAFDGPVRRLATPQDALAAGGERTVVLAGEVALTTEVRKALNRQNVPLDSPFRTEGRGLIEVRRWTMTLELSVLAAPTGATLYRREFREEHDYVDLEKPADFAFSELSERIRAKLLPLLLGSPTLEARTLLGR